MDADQPVGFKRGRNLAQLPDVDERCFRAQPNLGRTSAGHDAVDVIWVDDPLLTA